MKSIYLLFITVTRTKVNTTPRPSTRRLLAWHAKHAGQVAWHAKHASLVAWHATHASARHCTLKAGGPLPLLVAFVCADIVNNLNRPRL